MPFLSFYSVYVNLLYSSMYANESYLIDIDPTKTLLTPPKFIQNPGKYTAYNGSFCAWSVLCTFTPSIVHCCCIHSCT